MTDIFAAFFRLPFERKTFGVLKIDDRIICGIEFSIPRDCKLIVVNLNELNSGLAQGDKLPKEIFDINLARRILVGKSAASFKKDNAPWNGLGCLGRSFGDDQVFGKIRSIELNKFGKFSDWLANLPENWANELIEAIKKEWGTLTNSLQSEGLFEHFINIEMPLLKHFCESGLQGVKIDQDTLKKKYTELDKKYYETVRELEVNYGYFITRQSNNPSFDDIAKYVDGALPSDFSRKYFWESVESHQNVFPFLKSLYQEHSIKRDFSELLRIQSSLSEDYRILYDLFGTVSGRILVSRPGIQYLKRSSRGILKPRDGHTFIYADYAQFEPGILAFLSGDKSLISIYNSGDVYMGLASIIGESCERSVAKEIFLSFIYGMRKENIKRRVTLSYGDNSASKVESFFSQFSTIEKWKRDVVESSYKTLKSKGVTGFIRYFEVDDSDYEIERWAPNHVIQSTASGVFKRALSNYIQQSSVGRLIIPMHDAILIEVINERAEQAKQAIEESMKIAFLYYCQGIECKIKFESFDS